MERGGVLDLAGELSGLFQKEDFLAFFDFVCGGEGEGGVSGLCKIAVPKQGAGKMNYLSLLFICDVPDEAAVNAAKAMEGTLVRNVIGQALPEAITVMALPAATPAPSVRIKQLDLILAEGVRPDARFVADKVYPALADMAGMQAGQPVWWEDLPAPPQPPPKRVYSFDEMDRSFFDRLAGFFRSRTSN